MIVGVLSDTHGRHERTAAALDVLKRCGAQTFVHCGDVGGERVLAELAGHDVRFVWGNTDIGDQRSGRYATALGLTPPAQVPLRFALAGKRLAVCHGHERGFEQLIQAHLAPATPDPLDYLFCGHSHTALDRRLPSGLRVINPGALHRAGVYTVATVDLASDDVRFWQVDGATSAAGEPVPFLEVER